MKWLHLSLRSNQVDSNALMLRLRTLGHVCVCVGHMGECVKGVCVRVCEKCVSMYQGVFKMYQDVFMNVSHEVQ